MNTCTSVSEPDVSELLQSHFHPICFTVSCLVPKNSQRVDVCRLDVNTVVCASSVKLEDTNGAQRPVSVSQLVFRRVRPPAPTGGSERFM